MEILANLYNSPLSILTGANEQKYSLKGKNFSALEETDYILRIQSGDEEALIQFVEANTGLIGKVVHYYSRNDTDDILQEGRIALIKAALDFDVNKGEKFSTHAIYQLMAQFNQYFKNRMNVNMGKDTNLRISKLEKIIKKYIEKNGQYPTSIELSQIMSCTTTTIEKMLPLISDIKSLDAPLNNETEDTLMSIIKYPMPNVDEFDLTTYLKNDIFEAMRSLLSEKDYKIISLIFGINGYKLSSIGEVMKALKIRSKADIYRAINRFITKLKESNYYNILASYYYNDYDEPEKQTKI